MAFFLADIADTDCISKLIISNYQRTKTVKSFRRNDVKRKSGPKLIKNKTSQKCQMDFAISDKSAEQLGNFGNFRKKSEEIHICHMCVCSIIELQCKSSKLRKLDLHRMIGFWKAKLWKTSLSLASVLDEQSNSLPTSQFVWRGRYRGCDRKWNDPTKIRTHWCVINWFSEEEDAKIRPVKVRGKHARPKRSNKQPDKANCFRPATDCKWSRLITFLRAAMSKILIEKTVHRSITVAN